MSKSFKELQAEWYRKLAATGFEDIEDHRKADAPLKSWHDHRFKRTHDVTVESTRTYYERASLLLHNGKFRTPTYRRIWELHSAGMSERKIMVELAKDPTLIHYTNVKVHYVIAETKKQMSDVIVRQFIPEMDTALIYSSWPKGVYYGVRPRPVLPKNLWFTDFFRYAQQTLATGRVFVACMSEDPTTIIGYAILSGMPDNHVLEFVYVKGLLREQGIATLLTKNKGIMGYRNATKAGRAF